MTRRVVILSPGSRFTDDVLATLARRGVEVDALVVYVQSALDPWRKATGLGRLHAAAMAPARWLGWRLRRGLRTKPSAGAARVVHTGTVNGARMLRDLRRLQPGVVVLATCSLIAPPALQVAKEGVINVHPGLLPWARGNHPSGNSLLRDVPLGCTAFWVDEGIDTGPVIERRLLRVGGGETLPRLREMLHALWVEMTADVIEAAGAGADLPRMPQSRRFPLGRTISAPQTLARLDELAAAGRPGTLFEAWLPFADAVLRLPPEADARIAALYPGAGTPADAPPAREPVPER